MGLRIHPGKTKILSNQSSDTRKEIEVHDKSRNTDKRRKHETIGPDDYLPATGDDRNQKPSQGCLGDVPQVQTGADIEKLPAQTSTPAVQRCGNSDDMLRIRHMDTHKRARKNESTRRKMLRLIIQTKRRYKKILKRKDETNEEKKTNDFGTTGDESEDGQSSITHNDQDSDVSFENDTDEEIDTTVIEEEDWIEYIKRRTDEAMEKMENVKIRCRNMTHKK